MSKVSGIIKQTIKEAIEGKQLMEGVFKNQDIEDKENEENPGMRSSRKPSPPFEGPYKTKKSAKPGKYGLGFSTAKHLAKQGMKSVTKEESEIVSEVSNELLDRYKEKAKKDADDLADQGKYGKSLKRRTGVMKAVGKQIVNTTGNIKKALNKEEYVTELSTPTLQKYKSAAKARAKNNEYYAKYGDPDDNERSDHADQLERRKKGMERADKRLAKEEVEKAMVGNKPGWMMKADPKLAALLKARQNVAKKRQASYGDPSAGKTSKKDD